MQLIGKRASSRPAWLEKNRAVLAANSMSAASNYIFVAACRKQTIVNVSCPVTGIAHAGVRESRMQVAKLWCV